jgi:predicted aldo/keto reductase-like oxidoreductase
VSICRATVADGRFDCILLAYNFSTEVGHYRGSHGWPELRDVVKEIAAKDIGLVAMKIQAGAWGQKLIEKQDYSKEAIQASMRWAYKDNSVTCPVISVGTFEGIDNMVEVAMSPRMSRADQKVLERYMADIHGRRCPIPCPSPCSEACPHGIPVNDVQRYRMYYESYGQTEQGQSSYAGLTEKIGPLPCDTCTDRPCQSACPYGVKVAQLMTETDRLLTA